MLAFRSWYSNIQGRHTCLGAAYTTINAYVFVFRTIVFEPAKHHFGRTNKPATPLMCYMFCFWLSGIWKLCSIPVEKNSNERKANGKKYEIENNPNLEQLYINLYSVFQNKIVQWHNIVRNTFLGTVRE